MIRLSLAIILTLAALGAFGLDVAARLGPPQTVQLREVLRADAHTVIVGWRPWVSLSYTYIRPCPHCRLRRHADSNGYCPLDDERQSRCGFSRNPTFRIRHFFRFDVDQSGRRTNFDLSVSPWLLACLLGIYPLHSTWSVFRRRPGHCRHCNYDLTGNVSGICPECGNPAHPAASKIT